MRRFVNSAGCEMNFADDITNELIEMRLSWMATPSSFKEIKDEKSK